MDNELKRMREIPENSRNAGKRIPHDLVRAQAHELQVAGGSSSMRKDTGLRSLIQMPEEGRPFYPQKALARGGTGRFAKDGSGVGMITLL